MKNSQDGIGPLFMSPDPDAAREFFRNKPRQMFDKRMSAQEATNKFISDGTYLASGGFGTNRISVPIFHEILRQGIKNLGFLGNTTTHDFELLCAGNCLSKVDAAYIVGLEARGLSPQARRAIQSGQVQVTEWTNYALSVRLQAAAQGVSFGLMRGMLGTDTMKYSAAKAIACPFTGKTMTALPAIWPDVSLIHVHEADIYGNARINGISVADVELSRASKHIILTTEKIVSNLEIRNDPARTVIPYYLVDAVVEAPYGSYPGNMAGLYFSDEAHLRQWLVAEKDPAAFEEFLQKYIYGVSSHEEYIELCGGLKRLKELAKLETLADREEA